LLIHVDPPPNFAEFRRRVESEFECHVREFLTTGPDELPVYGVSRKIRGEFKEYPVVITDDRLVMAPSLVRSICRYLEIEQSAFPMTALE